MRPGCMFGGFFWGLVLIILGITLFLNVTFHISIPIFQILFAAFFVYLGIRIMTGRRRWWHGWERWGGDRSVDITRSGDRHETVFGRSDVDLTGIQLTSTAHVDVSAVFGASVIRLSPATPVKILVSVAFGSVRLPSGGAEAFGEYTWKSPGLDESKPHLVLHAAAVFGAVRIEAR